MAAAVLLWDFGDTLVDETWMRTAPLACPDWGAAWSDVMADHADDWNVGRIDEAEVFEQLSARTGMSLTAIEEHATACCNSIRVHPRTWKAATERRRPQALVTVNPDLFLTRVAEPLDLARYFDVIVVSCEERTDDKTRLCDLALERLSFRGERSDALLIDNRSDLTDAWARSGGSAYHYSGDASFEADWPALLLLSPD